MLFYRLAAGRGGNDDCVVAALPEQVYAAGDAEADGADAANNDGDKDANSGAGSLLELCLGFLLLSS